MNTLIPLTRIFDAAVSGQLDKELGRPRAQTPRADILEGEKEFQIAMDMPGVKIDQLEIDLESQNLTVKARRETSQAEGFETRRRERPNFGSFERTFTLGNAVKAEKIEARLEDGVLMITLPKTDQSLPRRIEVQ